MPIFKADIRVYASAYVRAESAEEAANIINAMHHDVIHVGTAPGSEIEISDRQFDDRSLPDQSLSPAMTIDIETPIDPDMIEEVD